MTSAVSMKLLTKDLLQGDLIEEFWSVSGAVARYEIVIPPVFIPRRHGPDVARLVLLCRFHPTHKSWEGEFFTFLYELDYTHSVKRGVSICLVETKTVGDLSVGTRVVEDGNICQITEIRPLVKNRFMLKWQTLNTPQGRSIHGFAERDHSQACSVVSSLLHGGMVIQGHDCKFIDPGFGHSLWCSVNGCKQSRPKFEKL